MLALVTSHLLRLQISNSLLETAASKVREILCCISYPQGFLFVTCFLGLLVFVLFFFFWDRIFLCSPGCPGIHRYPPASWVLGLRSSLSWLTHKGSLVLICVDTGNCSSTGYICYVVMERHLKDNGRGGIQTVWCSGILVLAPRNLYSSSVNPSSQRPGD